MILKILKMKMMKKIIYSLCSIALLAITLTATAQKDKQKRYEFVKERNINKTYPASGNKLNINNSFGDVKIITWDKNEIQVDIHIEASSNEEKNAVKTFEAIDVTDRQSGNNIYFKTTTDKGGKNKNYHCNNCHTTMSINYEIHMPANNSLDIENSFGGIIVPDFSGSLSLVSKFGSLTAGNLSNAEDVQVEFGKAKIKNLTNTKAVFKFSKIELDNITGSNNLKFEFCSASKLVLDNNATAVNISESYSTLNIKPAANFSATYDITTSFGSFKNRSNAIIDRTDKEPEYGADIDKAYGGKSGSGTVKVKIKSSFGKIILGDATADEMKDKKDKGSKSSAKEEVEL
jgi:hypothetical protein